MTIPADTQHALILNYADTKPCSARENLPYRQEQHPRLSSRRTFVEDYPRYRDLSTLLPLDRPRKGVKRSFHPHLSFFPVLSRLCPTCRPTPKSSLRPSLFFRPLLLVFPDRLMAKKKKKKKSALPFFLANSLVTTFPPSSCFFTSRGASACRNGPDDCRSILNLKCIANVLFKKRGGEMGT